MICPFCPSQELVEMIKAKKAAQEQVAAKNKKWQQKVQETTPCAHTHLASCSFNVIVLFFIL